MFDKLLSSILYSGADGILAQARDWEMKGEHSRAIDMYLKLTPNESEDTQTLANAWEKVCALMSLCIPLWNGFHTIPYHSQFECCKDVYFETEP